ncbi:MAG: hypothetical protein ACRCUY_04720 [Thermoguttaceae bacterium]
MQYHFLTESNTPPNEKYTADLRRRLAKSARQTKQPLSTKAG